MTLDQIQNIFNWKPQGRTRWYIYLGIVLNYCLIIRCLRCIIIFLNLRFGVISAVKTVKPIMKDEEYFTSYRYSPWTTGPKWYRELYIEKFSNSTNSNDDNTD